MYLEVAAAAEGLASPAVEESTDLSNTRERQLVEQPVSCRKLHKHLTNTEKFGHVFCTG